MARALVREIKDTRKNYLINGDMRLAQRGVSFAAIANTTYSLDRFRYNKVGTGVHTVSQGSDVPTLAQAGYLFQNSLVQTLTTPDTSIAATDLYDMCQPIEGYNFANLAQKTFTLSFWVKATLAGIYCVAFQNSGQDRSYVAEYTINTTNTWEYKTIVVSASPSAGSWNYTNGAGLNVRWVLAAGTNFQTTAGAWQTGDFRVTSNQVNGVNTGATSFLLTGVCLNEGSIAVPFSLFGEDLEGEIAACQRYYEKSHQLTTTPAPGVQAGMVFVQASQSGISGIMTSVVYKVKKRTTPTFVTWSNAAGGNNATHYHISGVADFTNASITIAGEHAVSLQMPSTGNQNEKFFSWAADAEL